MHPLKKTIVTTSLVLTLGAASIASAEGQDQHNSGILYQLKQSNNYWQHLPGLLQDSIGLTLKNDNQLMFETTPNIGKTVATFSSIGPILQAQNEAANTNTTTLNNDFNQSNTTETTGLSTYQIAKNRAELFGTDPNSLAANNFFLPTKYDTPAAKQTAQHYSGYASGAALALAEPTQEGALGFQEDLNYKTLTAIQSLNNYNFSTLYASRLPTPTPTSLSNIDSNNKGTISSQQLFNYLAMHKATDPQWYAAMQTASPFTNLRELLNFTAGIFMELHQMEQNQEQILATLSAQNTLMIMMEQQIQKENNHS